MCVLGAPIRRGVRSTVASMHLQLRRHSGYQLNHLPAAHLEVARLVRHAVAVADDAVRAARLVPAGRGGERAVSVALGAGSGRAAPRGSSGLGPGPRVAGAPRGQHGGGAGTPGCAGGGRARKIARVPPDSGGSRQG